jgi:hypothetical protein
MDRIVSKKKLPTPEGQSKAESAQEARLARREEMRRRLEAGMPLDARRLPDATAEELQGLGRVTVDGNGVDAALGVREILGGGFDVTPSNDPAAAAAIQDCFVPDEVMACRALVAVRGLAMAHPDRQFANWIHEAAKVLVFALLGDERMPPPDALKIAYEMICKPGPAAIDETRKMRWVVELVERFAARAGEEGALDAAELASLVAMNPGDSHRPRESFVAAWQSLFGEESAADLESAGSVFDVFAELRDRSTNGVAGKLYLRGDHRRAEDLDAGELQDLRTDVAKSWKPPRGRNGVSTPDARTVVKRRRTVRK